MSPRARDLVDWRIPSALEPRPEPIWLAILGLSAVVAVALCREATVDSAP